MCNENDPRRREAPPSEPARRGEHNELEYRNVDEESEREDAGAEAPQPGEAQHEH